MSDIAEIQSQMLEKIGIGKEERADVKKFRNTPVRSRIKVARVASRKRKRR